MNAFTDSELAARLETLIGIRGVASLLDRCAIRSELERREKLAGAALVLPVIVRPMSHPIDEAGR